MFLRGTSCPAQAVWVFLVFTMRARRGRPGMAGWIGPERRTNPSARERQTWDQCSGPYLNER